MAIPLGSTVVQQLKAKTTGETTIDNGATHTQLQYLARVYTATGEARFKDAFYRGLKFVFEMQYPNGGWPQFYPLRQGYYTHITYNDDAMVGVLELLRAITERKPDLAFVLAEDRERARLAIQKGIECILKTQVTVNGKLTAWCAQHDEETFAPAKARTYELPSLSGFETVGIVRFLMGIDKPGPEVIRSVQAAVSWLNDSKIAGLRVVRKPDPGSPRGYDTVVVEDAGAPPLWARFYDIQTNQPMFCGRDGVVKATMAEIEYERRNGYRWYVTDPAKLLDTEYPKWKSRWVK
jgi:PelA/Pel-15E family pectate lyase